jgi:hypothetical protein
MKPMLGWTMLSRDEIQQVERFLANGEQETRDEIGFLLIHQGFADRFFPGTSVLHTRVRYALFIPWVYQYAAFNSRRGGDIEAKVRRLLINLAIRLKDIGRETYDVIGGDKLGQITSQPPDRAYWSALRVWGLVLPGVDSRSEALRRLRLAARTAALDDDGGRLDDEATEVFAGLPRPPEGWDDSKSPLNFGMPTHEREFLRGKLLLLTRPGDDAPALLSRLVEDRVTFGDSSIQLPTGLDDCADDADRLALQVARAAAALTAIGRAVYGALVEHLIARDGGPDGHTFRDRLQNHFEEYGEAAARCDLDAAERLLPELPSHVKVVLRETQAYVRRDEPENFAGLRLCYQVSEVRRKSSRRARLVDTPRGAQRRAEWKPDRHNTQPLHYRWRVVRKMLTDLNGDS